MTEKENNHQHLIINSDIEENNANRSINKIDSLDKNLNRIIGIGGFFFSVLGVGVSIWTAFGSTTPNVLALILFLFYVFLLLLLTYVIISNERQARNTRKFIEQFYEMNKNTRNTVAKLESIAKIFKNLSEYKSQFVAALYFAPQSIDKLEQVHSHLFHTKRLIVLKSICESTIKIFTKIKGQDKDFSVNIKYVYPIAGLSSPITSYSTVCRSDDGNSARKQSDDKYQEISSNEIFDKLILNDMAFFKIDNLRKDIVDNTNRPSRYQLPNINSCNFYTSRLTVPIMTNKYNFNNYRLEKDKCVYFGFFTIDSKEENVFNDNYDVEILTEISYSICEILLNSYYNLRPH